VRHEMKDGDLVAIVRHPIRELKVGDWLVFGTSAMLVLGWDGLVVELEQFNGRRRSIDTGGLGHCYRVMPALFGEPETVRLVRYEIDNIVLKAVGDREKEVSIFDV
jgi:hypothetical protein